MGTQIKPQIGCAQNLPRNPALRIIFWLILGILCFAILMNWRASLVSLANTAAIICIIFAVLRVCASFTPRPVDKAASLPEAELPIYSVLVPLFREDNMVPDLMTALSCIDYPADKLEIFLICEAVDPQTIAAVQSNLRPPFQLIVVPKGSPQTKPRALNYALQFAKGGLVTIYDAEDVPHPQQLRKAAAAFVARPDWAALQAPLDYYNDRANWLTRQFALEYAALFHVWVPFLSRLGLPFPLGGTSNHIRGLMSQTPKHKAANVC